MSHSAAWTQIDDRRKKFVHTWLPDQTETANICVIHGLGEHGGRYASLAHDLVGHGLRVVAFDQQGHGQSHEKRGCIESYDSLLDDITAFLNWTKSTSSAPVVLFGHSMGGNLVLNYALRRAPIEPLGVISSSPMIRAVNQPTRLFESVARLIMRIAPDYQLQSRVQAERLMSDPQEQRKLRDDELFHTRLSLRLGGALLESGRWALNNADKLSTPLLLTHGTHDNMTCPGASQEFADQAGELCQLEILQDRLHDPFRDIEREQVVGKFLDFIRPLVAENAQ